MESSLIVKIDGSQAETMAKRLEGALTKLEKKGDELVKQNKKLSNELNKLKGTGDTAGKSLDGLKGHAEAATKSLKRLLKGLTVTAVAIATFKSAVRNAREFESGLIGVSKTTGLAGEELKTLGANLKGISRELPITTKELLTLSQSAGQMGVKGAANIEKFAITIAQLGKASDLAGEEAATSLARILNVTGETIESVDTLASVFVSLGNNMPATESEIARMTNEVARATSQFDISSAEAAAMAAAMTGIGVQAELGGSSVGRAMQAMTNAIATGGDELEKFTSTLNLNSEELVNAFKDSKVKAFNIFLEGVASKGLGAGKALKDINLGGQQVAKTIIPLANNLDVYRETQELANKEVENATALSREYEATLGTFDSQLILAKNNLSFFVGEITSGVLPALTNMLKAFNDLSSGDGLSKTVDGLATLVKIVVVGGALHFGLAALPVIAGSAATAFFTLYSNVLKITGAMKTGTGVIAMMNKSLFGTRISALAASGALGKLKIAAGLLFAAFAGWELGKWLRENFVQARVAGLAFVSVTLKAVERLKFGWKALIVSIKTLWTTALNNLKTSFANFIDSVGGALSKIPGFKTLGNELISFADSMKAGIIPAVKLKDEIAKLSKTRDIEIAKIDENIQGLVDYELATSNSSKGLKDSAEKLKDAGDILQEIVVTANKRDINPVIEQIKEARIGVDKYIDSLKFELVAMTLNDKERAIQTALRNTDKLATKGQREEIEKLIGQIHDEAAAKELAAAQSKQWQDAWTSAIERVDEAFANVWESAFKGTLDNFKDFASSLKDAFLSLLAELAHLAITRPIVMGFTSAFSGGGALGAAGTGGNILSALSTASGIKTLLSGISSGLAGSLANTPFLGAGLEQLGFLQTGVSPSLQQVIGAGGNPATALPGGINQIDYGAIGTAFAAGFAGTALGQAIFDRQSATGGFGAVIGAGVGSVIPGLGTAVGAFVGGLLDSALGSSDFSGKRVVLGASTGVNPSQSGAFDSSEILASGLQLNRFTRRADDAGLSKQDINNFFEQFKTIDAGLTVLSTSLGAVVDLTGAQLAGTSQNREAPEGLIGSFAKGGFDEIENIQNAGADFARAWLDAARSSFDEKLLPFLDQIGGTAEEMLISLGGLVDLVGITGDSFESLSLEMLAAIESGEETTSSLSNMFAALRATNPILDAVNLKMFDMSVSGAKAAESFIIAAGGLDRIAAASATYYDAFFTDEEKAQKQRDNLLSNLKDLKVETPLLVKAFDLLSKGTHLTTEETIALRAEFKNLVEAQDLTTESGAKAAIELMAMSGAIDTVITSAEEATAAFKEEAAAKKAATQEAIASQKAAAAGAGGGGGGAFHTVANVVSSDSLVGGSNRFLGGASQSQLNAAWGNFFKAGLQASSAARRNVSPGTGSNAQFANILSRGFANVSDASRKQAKGLDGISNASREQTEELNGISKEIETGSEEITKLRGDLIGKYNEQINITKEQLKEIQNSSNALHKIADGFENFKQSLLAGSLSALSPEKQYQNALNKFESVSKQALMGDIAALEALESTSSTFLEASRSYNASSENFTRDFNSVIAALDKTAENTRITADSRDTKVLEAEIAALNKKVEALIVQNGAIGTQTIESLELQLSEATKQRKAVELETQELNQTARIR